MFPFWNYNPPGRFPYATFAIILICFVVFLGTWLRIDTISEKWGFINAHHLRSGHDWLRLVTADWLHGDWLHILGNMWFLWIFGPRVEGLVGKWFLPLYLLGGVAAGIGSMFIAPNMSAAAIGASGAISFIMGIYWFAFPNDTILALNPLFTSYSGGDKRYATEQPVWIVILLWTGLQLIPAFMSVLAGMPDVNGVGYSAHLSGMFFGILIGFFLKRQILNNQELFMGRFS